MLHSADAGKLTLIRPDPAKHRQAIFDLAGKAFASNGYWNWLAYCRNAYIDNSHYDWQASTLGLIDGQAVTHWGVWRCRMRIGRARVRMAGVGAVATHGDFRKRGLMARTARAGAQAARAAGYDVSVLFGIRDFYHRFGYVRAWPYRTYFVPAGELAAGPAKMKLRPFPLRHRDDLAAPYNRRCARLTGSAVRPTFTANDKGWEGYLWHGDDEKPAGYVIVSDAECERFELIDHAGDTPRVLAALGTLAKRRKARELRCRDMHPRGGLARTLRRGTCRVETRYVRNGEAMIRTLNLATTLAKMCGELSARLKRSPTRERRSC